MTARRIKREEGRGNDGWTYFILDSVDDGEGERGRSPGEGDREEGEEERTCRLGAHVNSSDCDWQTIRHVPGIGHASEGVERSRAARFAYRLNNNVSRPTRPDACPGSRSRLAD